MLHLQNERKSGTVVAPADAAFASAFCRLPSPVAQPGGISLFTAKSLCQQSPSRSRLFHTPPPRPRPPWCGRRSHRHGRACGRRLGSATQIHSTTRGGGRTAADGVIFGDARARGCEIHVATSPSLRSLRSSSPRSRSPGKQEEEAELEVAAVEVAKVVGEGPLRQFASSTAPLRGSGC
jgi:hypothetical protein